MSKIDPLFILGTIVILFLLFSIFRMLNVSSNAGKLMHTPELSTQPTEPLRLNRQREIFQNESL